MQCARLLLRELGIQPSVDTPLDYVTPLVMLYKNKYRPTQFQLYTSLRHIAFTNTIFVYFGVLFIVLYAWPAFCHAIIKRILMMIDDGDAFVLCVQIRRKKRMTALLTVSLRNNSVLVSLKYSQHNAEIAFQ